MSKDLLLRFRQMSHPSNPNSQASVHLPGPASFTA